MSTDVSAELSTDVTTDTVAALASIAASRGMAHGEQLSRIARKYPARTAYICRGESRTFGEVDRRVTTLANALGERGLRHGDRLAVLMTNSIEMIEAIFAGWRLGAIVVPVNFRLVADEVQFILGDCGASVIVVDEGLAPLVGAGESQAPRRARSDRRRGPGGSRSGHRALRRPDRPRRRDSR